MTSKAEKLYSIYGKHSDIVIYEYRGKQYEVEYAKDNSYCCSPAWYQHKIEQKKIDEKLDNPKPEFTGDSWEVGFDLFWKYVDQE